MAASLETAVVLRLAATDLLRREWTSAYPICPSKTHYKTRLKE